MKQNQPLLTTGALLGAVTSIPVITLTYMGEQLFRLPFLPFNIFDWLARVLPGGLIAFVISLMVRVITLIGLPTSETAKLAERFMALVLFVLVGIIFGAVLAAIGKRNPNLLVNAGTYGGLILFLGAFMVESALGFPGAGFFWSALFLAAMLIVWGRVLVWLIQKYPGEVEPIAATEESPSEAFSASQTSPEVGLSRRAFVQLLGGSVLTIAISSLGLSALFGRRQTEVTVIAEPPDVVPLPTVDTSTTSGGAASPPESTLKNRIDPAPGTRPEFTANEDFYRIDINTRPRRIEGTTWKLAVGGLVENPLSLTIEEIRALPPVTQILTLSCISNLVGGDLIGTTRWTGVRLKDLLERAGMKPAAWGIHIQSVDGFFESVAMPDVLDDRTLLVYDMDGTPLTPEHGFPLRIFIPNRFGMKQPKWITSIDVIDREIEGYWVIRGWSHDAFVQTTSVIDIVAKNHLDPETNLIPVGGISYAGARGISKVEVQLDDSPWVETKLRAPPLSPLTWVQWRYDWPVESGHHTFHVRAYDGTGGLQTNRSAPPRPNGATGIHSIKVRV